MKKKPKQDPEPRYRPILAVIDEQDQVWFVAQPQNGWVEGSPLCQHGRHCGRYIISVGKDAYCPFCHKGVYLT